MTIIKVLNPVTLCFLDQWGQFILLPAARAEHRFYWRLIRFQSGPALCHLSSAVTADGSVPFCLAAFDQFLFPGSASAVCTPGWADESCDGWRSRPPRVRLPGSHPSSATCSSVTLGKWPDISEPQLLTCKMGISGLLWSSKKVKSVEHEVLGASWLLVGWCWFLLETWCLLCWADRGWYKLLEASAPGPICFS